MAYTVQQVLDIARIPLNDVDKVRYSDATLLTYFNNALLICRQKRPDLFLGKLTQVQTPLLATDTFPINQTYVPIFANYVSGMTETIDDEHIENSRAAAFVQSFMMGILQ